MSRGAVRIYEAKLGLLIHRAALEKWSTHREMLRRSGQRPAAAKFTAHRMTMSASRAAASTATSRFHILKRHLEIAVLSLELVQLPTHLSAIATASCLGLLEREVGPLPHRARVGHRVVQERREEVVAQVVVSLDVPLAATARVPIP